MSTDSERDQSTDRILKKAVLRRTDAEQGEACIDIDAETFAAWAEGALAEADAARVEAHLADCARCQAVMASFATSEPAAAAAGAPVVIPFRPKSPMRWLIPVAAGTAAASLLVWTAWPKPDASAGTASQTMARADAPVATSVPELLHKEVGPPAAAAKSAEAPAQSRLAASKESKTKDEARPADRRAETATSRVANEPPTKPLAAPPAAPPPPPRPLPSAIPPPAGTAAGVGAAAPPPPPVQVQGQQTQQAQQGTVRTEPPTISIAGSSDIVQTQPRSDRNALMFVAFVPGTIEFGPADPQQRALDRNVAAGGGGGGRGGGGGGAAGGAARAGGQSTAAAEVAIPLTNIRWRILPTGQVGKTIDAGLTWQAIPIDPPARVTNGAAPSATVCWLIGRGGVVLRSIDGIKFGPVTFPEAVDLRSITAIDARRATVTTVDGRTYTTTDAGLSWK